MPINRLRCKSASPPLTMPITLAGHRQRTHQARSAAAPGPGARGPDVHPGEADRYRFQARKGQELVIAASARELIPYLADAVPGWFKPF